MRVTSTVALQFQRPGTPGFVSACAGFDLSAIPTPDVAVSVTDEHDVRAAVRFAADHGMPVAVRATGHGPVAGVDHGVLVDTRALSTVTADPARRTATAGGGVRWAQVLTRTAPLRLIPLCGSSPDVGVAAYTLGGGLGPLGRLHGWAADRVRRIRLVTPDGELREVTAHTDPELFWALRGGGGGFGVVTEVEFDLVAGDALYGGGLYLPGESAPELLAAFGRSTATAPDELSLSVAFITFPDIDPVPAPLRGRFVAHLRVTYVGSPAAAERLIAPLRAVATPLLDTVRPLPIVEFGTIHGDPTRPQPVSCGGAVLPRWDDAAVAVLLAEIGPAPRTCWSCGTSVAPSPGRLPSPTRWAIATRASPSSPPPTPARRSRPPPQRRPRCTSGCCPGAAGVRSTTSPPGPTGATPTRAAPSTSPPSPGSGRSRRRTTRRTSSATTFPSRS